MGKGIKSLFSRKGEEALQKILESEEGVLLRQETHSPKVSREVALIPVADIVPTQFQARKFFDEERLVALAESLKDRGMLQPILVRKTNQSTKYELIAGERRLRAAKSAALTEIPAIVKELEDKDVKAYTLIENLQREDLNVVEKTIAIGSFQEDIGDTRVTAEKLRLTRRSVERYVMIYKVISSETTLLSLFQRNAHAIDFRAAEAIAKIGRYLKQEELNKFVDLANKEGIAQAIKQFRHSLSAIVAPKRKSQSVFCLTKETESHVFFQAKYTKGAEFTAQDREIFQKTYSDFLGGLEKWE